MLISYRHRFIFIHVYKVAGSSVFNALRTYAEEPGQPLAARVLRPFGIKLRRPLDWAYREKDFADHVRARDVRERLTPAVYRRFYSFAFVRNPWDWLVSLYHYMLDSETHPQHEFARKTFASFDEYVEWKVANDVKLQKTFVTDEQGRTIVDCVGRIENLRDDFGAICRRIGIRADLPHVNRSRHADYRGYYSDRTRSLVADAFGEDIELCRYEFDGPCDDEPLSGRTEAYS